MEYNDMTFYTYHYGQGKIGYKVYHFKNGVEVWDCSFMHEEDAMAYAASLNAAEAARVAGAKARIEAAMGRIMTPASPYYSITGYYGD